MDEEGYLVRALATGGLTCGHHASPATTRVGPATGEVYCSLCALASIHGLTTEIVRTATALETQAALAERALAEKRLPA